MVPIRSHMDCKRVQESKLSFKWWNQKQRHTKICRLFIKRGTWHFNSGQFVAKYINVKRSWMCVSYRQSTPTEICQNEDRWRRRGFFLPDRATTLNANSIFEKKYNCLCLLPVAASFKNFLNVRFIEGFYFIQSDEKGRY